MKSTVTPEVYFAQHLAANDNTIRLRAMKKLRYWFMSRSRGSAKFTEDDMLKIWKGLYYCMWMCDKPLNQESLSDNISELLHCFSKPMLTLLFIDTFFQSMAKEWFGIDRFRIEKFMMLIRRFLQQCFCFVSRRGWKSKHIQALLDVLKGHVMNPKSDSTPSGLKLHIIDIYLDELAKAGGCDLSPKKFQKLLMPYVTFLLESDDNIQLVAIVKDIFHALIWQAFHEEDDEENGEEDEVPVVTFQVDYNSLADLLLKFSMSKKKKIKSLNLEVIYKLVAKLRTAANGEFPFEQVDSEDDLDEKKSNKINVDMSAKTLLGDDLIISEERRERLKQMREKKKRQKEESSDSSSEIDNTNQGDYQAFMDFKESEPHRKKKKSKFRGKLKKAKADVKSTPRKNLKTAEFKMIRRKGFESAKSGKKGLKIGKSLRRKPIAKGLVVKKNLVKAIKNKRLSK